MTTQANAQAFYLSSGLTAAGPAQVPMTATAALPLILDDLTVSYDVATYRTSEITRLTLAGQNLLCSTQNAPLAMLQTDAFFPTDQRSIGLTIDSNQQLFLEAILTAGPTANNPVGFACATSPTDVVISPNAAPMGLLNYIFGMGRQNLASGATAQFQAVCLRDGVFLGRMIADARFNPAAASQDPNQIVISSILIDGVEMMSNQTPALANGMSVRQLLAESSTFDGIDYGLNQNSVVTVTVTNTNALGAGNDCDVVMGFFCRPTI